MSPFLTRLHSPDRPVIVFDGAMGTSSRRKTSPQKTLVGRSTKVATSIWYTPSQRRWKVHRDFLAVGADVIETDTFGAASIVLAEYDLADQAYSLNKTAAQLAKRVASSPPQRNPDLSLGQSDPRRLPTGAY